MERPLKTYWTNLIIETERAIKLYKTHSIMAASKLKQIFNSTTTTPYKRDIYYKKVES
jgi:hypothetical protein